MENFNDRYELDFPEMEVQHHYLYSLFDKLKKVNENTPEIAVKRLLNELEKYLMFHFASEQNLMRMYNYPGFSVHQSDHEKVEEKFVQFLDDFERKQLQPQALRIFLTGWLMEHSIISDTDYVKWIKEQRARV